MKVSLAFVILITGVLSGTHVRADSAALIVHEWGTFTSFQDSNGGTISGINVDDEPVPKFVHRLRDMPIFTTRSLPGRWSQGYPSCHPDVTLRLETPVLYFYPQPTFASDQALEVRATFIGGWLTEFFPFAVVEKTGPADMVDRSTQSSLQWSRLRLATNSAANLPQTEERVWLAPRKVRSAVVIADEKHEAEKYLFYRGVGHLDAPLIVRQQDRSLEISLRDGETFLQKLPPIWIVQVLPDGRVRYRRVPAGERSTVTASIPTAIETAPSELGALRQELAEALVAEGLFKDEARAMLETWQLSYFESEGLRLFFVLPPSWTNAHLPLSISAPADITRVMLGRVELISDHQREALRRLYELPLTAFDLTPPLYYESQIVLERMHQGNVSHAELYALIGREVPEALKLYDSLGRFRDALLVHEWRSASDENARERITRAVGRFSSCKAKFTIGEP
jgi:hypothetical protein